MFEKQEDRFMRLAAPCERAVYYTCLSYMKNSEDAKDAAQDTMLRAYRAFSSFRGVSGFKTWLHTICARVCIDLLRKRGAQVSLDALSDEGYEIADDAPLPYEQIEEKQRKALLREALLELPDAYRVALVMTALQGLRYEDAAELLHVPVGTVRSRVSRAKAELKKILSKNGELFLTNNRLSGEGRERG